MADRPHLLGVGEHHLGDVRCKDLRDGQGVAGRLEDHAVIRRQAAGEQSEFLGAARHPASRARPATVGDSDLAEVAFYVEPDRSAHGPPPEALACTNGRRRARTTLTDSRS